MNRPITPSLSPSEEGARRAGEGVVMVPVHGKSHFSNAECGTRNVELSQSLTSAAMAAR